LPLVLIEYNHFVSGKQETTSLQSSSLATYLIENSVRNAVEIQLLDTVPGTLESNYNYLYFDENYLVSENESEINKTFLKDMTAVSFSYKEETINSGLADEESFYFLELTLSFPEGKTSKEYILLNNIKEISNNFGTTVLAYSK
ncbi:MAG: hypothetical protein ACOC2O_02620, partial [Bacillota bacterium]